MLIRIYPSIFDEVNRQSSAIAKRRWDESETNRESSNIDGSIALHQAYIDNNLDMIEYLFKSYKNVEKLGDNLNR
jgi:hypothetical protein